MNTVTSQSVKFGQFDFDAATSELKRGGAAVKLQAQPAKVLGVLVSRAGALVTRQELQQAVGGDNFVEFDQGLNFWWCPSVSLMKLLSVYTISCRVC